MYTHDQSCTRWTARDERLERCIEREQRPATSGEIMERVSLCKKASKRISVTEERWWELNELTRAGQTYDELLKQLIEEHERRQLAERTRAVRAADAEKLTRLDDV